MVFLPKTEHITISVPSYIQFTASIIYMIALGGHPCLQFEYWVVICQILYRKFKKAAAGFDYQDLTMHFGGETG